MGKKSTRATSSRGHVTLDDIAEACGVSRMTVSYALRGQRQYVSESNIQRINQAARQMGYDSAQAHAARSLRYKKQGTNVASYVVAVFFPVQLLEAHYYAMLFQGIQEALLEQRFGALSCYVEKGQTPVADQLPQIFRRGDVDGAIIMHSSGYDASLVEGLRGIPGFGDRPVVSLLEPMAGCDAVLADDVEIGRLAASHLLELGHRKLLRFSNPHVTNYIVEQRQIGHARAFEQAGLALESHLVNEAWIWDDPRGVQTAIEHILEQHPDITAILAPNDDTGIPVARALRRIGKRIPHDVSIIGADDCAVLYGPDDQNIWSTVRVPLLDIGRTAAVDLIQRVNQQDTKPTTRILPVELVARGTTGPPPPGK
jgi:LacI family transcriptional regulator